MCAQFELKVLANMLGIKFGIKISSVLPEMFNLRARGFIKTDLAPVIVANGSKLELKMMCFSLCPSWSKEFPYKWTSYNARMERNKVNKDGDPILDPKTKKQKVEYIYEIPTWRESFNKKMTCLIPMNKAIESSYFGSEAGNIIGFSQSDDDVFFVTGLWSEWKDTKTGEVKDTFTLITDDPYEFFFKAGHDRSVFVINENAYEDWLLNEKYKPIERFNFLRENRISLHWKVNKETPMKKGWEKRAPTNDEINAIRVFTPY